MSPAQDGVLATDPIDTSLGVAAVHTVLLTHAILLAPQQAKMWQQTEFEHCQASHELACSHFASRVSWYLFGASEATYMSLSRNFVSKALELRILCSVPTLEQDAKRFITSTGRTAA